jgi:membrane fusion protein (multidrug efflux system)
MVKRIIFTSVCLLILIGALAGIKALQIGRMVAHGKSSAPPPEIVTATEALSDSWESIVTSTGSLEAVQGVMVSAELTGKVTRIDFESGAKVRAGGLLVQQDISIESAQLRAAETEVTLAKTSFERAEKLLPEKVISQADFDTASAGHNKALAQLDNIRAVIAKKTIRAPFSGRVGIRLVNLGQTLEQKQPIVTLQALDPIYVNFLLPQYQLSRIQPGLSIRITTDTLSGRSIEGTITAINPEVESATRNIRVQATVSNPDEMLRPGMYANVSVVMPEKTEVLTIPATAVLYAPYSDSVFVVEAGSDADGRPGHVVRQQFVQLGEKRGDFVAILNGLKKGDTVVSTGVFKLRNGQAVMVDNRLAPEFKLTPNPNDA